MTNCNPSLCNTCRNHFTCQKYRSYVETMRLANHQQTQSPLPTQPAEALSMSSEMSSTVDSNVILQELLAFKTFMADTVSERCFAIEAQVKPIAESIASLDEAIKGMSKKMFMIDGFVDMLEKYNDDSIVKSNDSKDNESGLAVYNGEENSGKIIVEKKGFLGIGKKWVEEDINKV